MKKEIDILSIIKLRYSALRNWVIGIVACVSFSYTQTLGDLNQDGLINLNDILREVNIVLNLPPIPTEDEMISGDLNVDEEIDISDILITVDIITNNLDEYCTNDQWDIPCDNNYSQCCYPITSHEFEWEIFYYGFLGQSTPLPTCKILAPDDIWCLGQLHNVEIDNPFEGEFNHGNFLHDEGSGFEMVDVIGNNPEFQNEYHLTNPQIFSSTDMLWSFDSYSEFNFLNGNSIIIIENEGVNNPIIPPVLLIQSIWGFNNSNLYIGYRNGYIFYWDGSTFQQMDSPIADPPEQYNNLTYGIQNIYGLDENHIYANSEISAQMPSGSQNKLLFNDGISNSWEIIYEEPESILDSTEFYGDINGIWGFRDSLYLTIYSFTHQIWQQSIHSLDGTWIKDEEPAIEHNLFKGIDGNHYNDIFLINENCQLKHYNGESWDWDVSLSNLIEENLFTPHTDYICKGLTVNEDIIIVTGGFWEERFILKGTRITNE